MHGLHDARERAGLLHINPKKMARWRGDETQGEEERMKGISRQRSAVVRTRRGDSRGSRGEKRSVSGKKSNGGRGQGFIYECETDASIHLDSG